MNATDRPPLAPPDPATRYQEPTEPPRIPPPPRRDEPRPGEAGSRAAAWVTGTGAFLLVVAAAVFIAVRWSAMPLELKVAIVGGLTGGVLALGAKLQPKLPIAGRTLLHLGAFLLPVDVGALAARLDATATATVLAEGAVVTIAFPFIAKLAGSRTLRVLSLTGPVLLATGLAAIVGVPAPILLTVGAAAVLAAARGGATADGTSSDLASGATLTAAVTPVLALFATAVDGAPGLPAILVDAGWARPLDPWLAAAPAVIATAVLIVAALGERSRRTATAATLMPLVGLATVLVSRTAGDLLDLLALPLVFVTVEIVALVAGRDELWRGPSNGFATVLEWGAGLATLPATLLLFWLGASIQDPGGMFSLDQADDPAAALGVAALGAAIAAGRRSEGRGIVHAYAGVAAVLGALAIGWSTFVLVAPLVVLAAVALLLARLGDATGVLVASALALVAVLATGSGTTEGPWVGAVALAVGVLGVDRARGAAAHTPVRGGLAVALTLASLAFAIVVPFDRTFTVDPVVSLPLFAAAALVLARVASSGSRDARHIDIPADVARLGVLVVSLAVAALDRSELSAGQATVALTITAALAIGDAIIERRVVPAVAAAVPLHHLAVLAALEAGVSRPALGAGLVAVGAVWGAIATELHRREADLAWVSATATLAGGASLVGWGLAISDQTSTGIATIVLGLMLVAAGVLNRLPIIAHVGGVVTTIGTWVLLEGAQVDALEWYVAPVSAQLIAVGMQVRSRDRAVSSWLAYAPAILLFVAPAITGRLDGGSGWHAVAAGVAGVAAVAVGGWRRLGAPLVLGVATVVTVTLIEALAFVSSVPTWAWLATGGATLLAAGIALERSGTSPTVAGRRLLADYSDRFA